MSPRDPTFGESSPAGRVAHSPAVFFATSREGLSGKIENLGKPSNLHHPQHFAYGKFTVLPNLLYNQMSQRSVYAL